MNSLLKQLVAGRFLGHPVHLMLVHFPSGLFPMALALDAAALVSGEPRFAMGSLFALAGGVAGGFAAALFGALDYLRIPSRHPAWGKASLHAGLNVLWLMAFAVLFALKWKHYPAVPVPTIWELGTSAILVGGLMVSNFFGGELVLRHRLGVIQEGQQHSHTHPVVAVDKADLNPQPTQSTHHSRSVL